MADDLTKLDAPALQQFIDNDLQGFITDIEKLRSSDSSHMSLYDLYNAPLPVDIASMAGDSDTGGKNLVSNAQNAAKAIDQVLSKHDTAFKDLQQELRNVISTMLGTQQKNLEAVDGQKFLSAISGYDGDMGGGSGGLSGFGGSSNGLGGSLSGVGGA